MKKITFANGFLSLIIGMVLMVGCGETDDSSSSSSNKAELDTKSINKLGTNAASAIPGCEYTSDSVATLNSNKMVSYKVIIDTIKREKPLKQKMQKNRIDEVKVGECGGKFTIKGDHDNGDNDVTYAFDNYCTKNDKGQVTMNGKADVFVDGTPSDNGPIVDSTTVSTGSGGISTISVVDNETLTKTVYIDKLKLKGDLSNASVTADEIKVVSDEGTYRVTDVKTKTNSSGESSTFTIISTTYYDPDEGAVTLSSSAIPTSKGATGGATLTVTSSGNSAVFSTDDVSTGLFTVKEGNGNTVGALDCSGLSAD